MIFFARAIHVQQCSQYLDARMSISISQTSQSEHKYFSSKVCSKSRFHLTRRYRETHSSWDRKQDEHQQDQYEQPDTKNFTEFYRFSGDLLLLARCCQPVQIANPNNRLRHND
eukprot:329580_1